LALIIEKAPLHRDGYFKAIPVPVKQWEERLRVREGYKCSLLEGEWEVEPERQERGAPADC
jgi:hypothetical protein